MVKIQILQNIIESLEADLSVFSTAARAAHDAATNEECQPDNKYDTTALEASYIAQGQANRAQEIRIALESYRTIKMQSFDDDTPVRLTALVTLEDEEGSQRMFFLGPHGGGLKVTVGASEIVVITPQSPLGRNLLGKLTGDEVRSGENPVKTFTILEVS
jgi:transcription elongation GreA/GreB family factor